MEKNIRSLFPVTRTSIYLDTAYMSPAPVSVLEASNAFLKKRSLGDTGRIDNWIAEMDQVALKFANLINAHPDEIALTTNTTEGTNIVANMLNLTTSDTIVWDELEYNSNKLVWLNQEKTRGAKNIIIKSLDGTVKLEDYFKAVTKNTRVISISLIAHNNGFRYDLKKLADLAHANGAYLHVDASQAVGAVKVDVKETDIDFLTCGAYKWLLGPNGLAFFYIRKDLIEKFNPVYQGWMQVEKWSDDPASPSAGLFHSARKFMTATQHFQGFYEMNEALKLIENIGILEIEEQNLKLSRILWEGINQLGYQLLTPPDTQSSIVAFTTKQAAEIENVFKKNRIIVTQRENLVRISPHFFNTEDEIKKVIDLLKPIREK